MRRWRSGSAGGTRSRHVLSPCAQTKISWRAGRGMSMWVRNVRLVCGRDQGRRLLHFWEVAREAGECGCTERDRALRFHVSLFNTQLNDSPVVGKCVQQHVLSF